MLTPARRDGTEILDGSGLDPRVVQRSMGDVARANALFGGASALLAELEPALRGLPPVAMLLDIGTGLGDIPARARSYARSHGIALGTLGVDVALELAAASARQVDAAVCADALRLPFADKSVDVVTCSQVLHHFPGPRGIDLLREMDRVARTRVVVSDLRRSWTAAGGLWVASFPLRFHPVSRHDGVVSVLRGFTSRELAGLVEEAVGAQARVSKRFAFRVTTSWAPR
ncbi:MAG: methyltransferase domain-containing protein [Gemmatimonadaceae bacterium]